MKSRVIETHKSAPIAIDLRLTQNACQPGHRSIEDLKPSTRNPRTHAKKQVAQLRNSILQFGFTAPILVDDQDNIIAGHGRYLAATELGLEQVPVIVISGLSDAKKRALALADNKIALNSGWDRELLAAELSQLGAALAADHLDVDITGFEPVEIDALMGDLIDPEADPADQAPQLRATPVSKRGDVWQLGGHRLGCGDSAADPDLRALMGDQRAAMVFADPPYNVAISSVVGRGKIKHREFDVASGEMSSAQYPTFLARHFGLLAHYAAAGALHYICMDWRHLREVLAAGDTAFGPLVNLIVWAKTNAGQGSFYRSQHELILLFRSGAGPHLNNIELGRHGRSRANVWTYAGVNAFRAGRLDELAIHPTVKPVALVADAMRDCTRRGDIVLDPFMGSGTTLLAAERVGRRAYGLEIDPLYVDAAIRRWQAFTRRDAMLTTTGQTFDEVAAATKPGRSQ
jgi:DNA modification methylase